MKTALVWFRRDLRLHDNPALTEALKRHSRVVPVFIWAPEEENPWAPGAASRWWLHHSLTALNASLTKLGAPLIVRKGHSLATLRALAKETGAESVFWNRLYEPAVIKRDKKIKEALRGDGLTAESLSANLWFEPWESKTLNGDPYRVFTPFWKQLRPRLPAREPLPAPKKLQGSASESESLGSLNLLPRIPWDSGFRNVWTPGEAGALKRLDEFCKKAVGQYQERRDFPSELVTSRLSPHLHFGELSPVQIFARVQRLLAQETGTGVLKNAEGFLRELAWREFAHHLLFHFPQTPQKPMYDKFANFPWSKDTGADLKRWQQGQTGIPIVDAGMRELWATGIMHNRVRMIAAGLLTKNLLIPWQQGARWFWDTLVDADLANNTLGWQWVAGCGADAAPYFRVFNPVLQSRKFEAAAYIRRWVPELATLADDEIHEPREPIVDLANSRERALMAYQKIK